MSNNNTKNRTRIKLNVPATTANMGPGFDCMGMAMEIWNTIVAELSDRPEVSIEGLGANELSRGKDNVVYRAASLLYREAGLPEPPLHFYCHNRIPMRRGLGSSASAIVGGLVAANYLAGEPFKREELLPFTLQMEHHPDNLAPCLLGGCRVVVVDRGVPIARAVPLPDGLGIVLYVPDFEIPTPRARAILPELVPMKDAIYNTGRAALLVNALGTGSLDDLKVATQDRLHQPARSVLFPAMNDIFKAALDGGAKGVFLSGSGSTIMTLTKGHEEAVGQAMAEAARKANVPGKVVITRPCLDGAHIVID